MEPTAENVCNLLAQSKLLSPEEAKKAFQIWTGEAGPRAKDGNQFSKWLVDKQYLTSYQAVALLRGHSEHFFFGQYKLLDRIAKGKMAGVYKAAHRLGQVVAIKVLPPSKAKDPEAFGRFQREARMAQRLKHPNVVRTFQIGQSGPLNYLVMEYLEGETLAEILQQRGRLPPVEAAHIVHQALLGLQHVHEQGMVHRDLNPDNLMILPGKAPSEPVQVKILDIGLGRAMFEEGTPVGEVNLTRDDSMIGSPDYMAPEQAKHAHDADIRADIYSLGCVLYHALAGQVPFTEKNAVRKMMCHASLPAAPLQAFNPAISPALQAVVEKMMAKDPAERYATPALAAKVLDAYLQSEALAVQPAPVVNVEPAYLQWLEAEPAEVLPGDPAPLPTATPKMTPQEAAQVNVELVPVYPQQPRSDNSFWIALGLVAVVGMLVVVLGVVVLVLWLRR
jgi:serine/threonine protein kinase